VTGQTLYHDAREGRASSIDEVEVHAWDAGDDAGSEWTVSTTSIDSVNTTFNAASGASSANPNLCNLTATTSIVAGREYLATTTDGRREWVPVVGITSAVSVESRFHLFNDYVSTNAFVGTRLSFTVDASWVANSAKLSPAEEHHPHWRIRWVYTVSSVQYVAYTTFDLVRYPARHRVTVATIENLVAGFASGLPLNHRKEQASAFIDEAYRQFRLDLYQERIDDAQLRDADVIDEMVTRKALHMWTETRLLTGQGDTQAADRAKTIYWERFGAIFKHPSQIAVPVSTDTSGAGSIRLRTGITVR
jgi:hypothetical protein